MRPQFGAWFSSRKPANDSGIMKGWFGANRRQMRNTGMKARPGFKMVKDNTKIDMQKIERLKREEQEKKDHEA